MNKSMDLDQMYDIGKISLSSFIPDGELTVKLLEYLSFNEYLNLNRQCSHQDCNSDMKMYTSKKYKDGYELRCTKHQNKRESIRKGSFFEGMKLPITTIMYIINHLSAECTTTSIKRLIDKDKPIYRETITSILTRLQHLMKEYNDNNQPQWDESDVIEIDEMWVKWHDPGERVGTGNETDNKSPVKPDRGKWLLGLINRTRTKVQIVSLSDRKKTSIQEVLKDVLPSQNMTIMTDALASYNFFDDENAHFVINKRWGFARNSYRLCMDREPENILRIHVNTIENNWKQLRHTLVVRSAYTQPHMVMNHVHEYVYNFYHLNWFNLIKIKNLLKSC